MNIIAKNVPLKCSFASPQWRPNRVFILMNRGDSEKQLVFSICLPALYLFHQARRWAPFQYSHKNKGCGRLNMDTKVTASWRFPFWFRSLTSFGITSQRHKACFPSLLLCVCNPGRHSVRTGSWRCLGKLLRLSALRCYLISVSTTKDAASYRSAGF